MAEMVVLTLCRRVLLAGCLLVVAVRGVGAQAVDGWDPGRLHMTRAGLEELLARYEQTTQSAAYTEGLRERARYEAALIRARLSEGDFQVGDRILLSVEGEQALTDTFTVAEGPALRLPVVGEIPLRGVLRSELQEHVTAHLRRFIRDPVVRAGSLIRIEIFGEVARPGFYVLPAETVVTDVLMEAGGLTRESRLQGIRVERGGATIWDGAALRQAIIEGRTLDQISMRAGDRLVVPRQESRNIGEVLRIALMSVPPAVLALVTLFGR